MIILVEFETLDPASKARCFWRFSDAPYCTGRADTPPDTPYLDLLLEAPQLARNAFSDGRTGGVVRRQGGHIVLANADGRLDVLLEQAVDGRPVMVRTGPAGGHYPEDFTVWLVGVLEGVEAPDEGRLMLLVRDAMAVFDAPLQAHKYAGDNVAPNGVEGTTEDLKDRPKPLAYGHCLNVPAPCVNASKLIYQVNDGAVADVPAVYDRGAAMTRGADYTGLEDLMNNGPLAGHYRVWRAGGLLRVGTRPDTLSADVLEGATAADRTTAQLICRIAARMGHEAISADDVAALDAAAPGEVGLWVEDDAMALATLDQLAAGAGAWVSLDASGVLRLGQLTAPEGDVALDIHPAIISDFRLIQSRDEGGGLPARRIMVRYGKNGLPMDNDSIAGVVTEARRAWLTQADRVSAWEDETVAERHPLSAEIERQSLLIHEADAQAEAARLGELYGVMRRLVRLTLSRSEAHRRLPALDLGVLVRVSYPRYGFKQGRLLRVIGIEPRANADSVVLDLWG